MKNWKNTEEKKVLPRDGEKQFIAGYLSEG